VTPITDDQLAARGAAIVRLASARVEPPLVLRERIEADRARPRPRPFALPAALTAGAAAIVIALVVSIGGEPSLDDAAALSSRAPTAPAAPPVDPKAPQLLAVSASGLPYPNWTKKFGWRATGARADELDGRATETVYYTNAEGTRIGYTIVSGDALDVPDGAARSTIEGTLVRDYVEGDRRIVAWERHGHTCVLAGPTRVKRQVMLNLAGWKGKGAVPF